MNKLVVAVQRVGGRIINFLPNTKKSISKLDCAEVVQVRLDYLLSEWAKYEAAWGTWQEADDESDEKSAFEDADRDDMQEIVEEAQFYLVKLKKRFVVAPVAVAVAEEPAPVPVSHIRLSPIKPPTFSGEWEEWGTFRDVFQALVIDNASLSNVHRLHFLREACVGKASSEIAGIALEDGNFATAWDALVKKFENERLVICRLIERLLNEPAMQFECSEQLSRLLNGTTNCLRALRLLDRPTDELDDFLVVLTVSKLDIVTRTAWEQFQGASKVMPTFAELDAFLCGVLGKLEALKGVKEASNASQAQDAKGAAQGSRNVRTHVVAVSNGKVKCAMCKGAHRLYDCRQFKAKSVSERRTFISKQRICYRCISGSRHLARACKSRYGCHVCHHNHHTMLHIADSVGTAAPAARAGGNVGARTGTGILASGAEIRATPLDGPSCVCTHSYTAAVTSTSDHRVTLLPTAWVEVTTADGRTAKLRALMDQGSEVSLISRQAVQKLGLKWREADVNLTGVAEATAGKLYGSVQFTAANCNANGRSVDMCALVVSTITTDLPSVKIVKSTHTRLAGLALADDTYWQTGKVDILFGAATIAKVLRQGVRRVDGLVAQETEFGWMLSGTATGEPAMQKEIAQRPMLSADEERCDHGGHGSTWNCRTARWAECCGN